MQLLDDTWVTFWADIGAISNSEKIFNTDNTGLSLHLRNTSAGCEQIKQSSIYFWFHIWTIHRSYSILRMWTLATYNIVRPFYCWKSSRIDILRIYGIICRQLTDALKLETFATWGMCMYKSIYLAHKD